jgi:hypothetical protein
VPSKINPLILKIFGLVLGQKVRKSGGYLKPEDAELAKLRRELAITKEERDILKKALGIFSATRK